MRLWNGVLRGIVVVWVLSLLLVGCGTAPEQKSSGTVTLNVFAAASLKESFTEIGKKFEGQKPGMKVTFNFAGSQVLEQQLENGAAADVFASADQANMQKASDAGLTLDTKVFVKNKLVVIVPASNPGKIESLKDLARKGVKIDMGASSVPAGKYSLQVLDKMGKSAEYGAQYVSEVKANVVSQEDNVKAVVQKVQLGEADAGFVYRTDVTAAIAEKVKIIEIPDELNVVAEYPIAALKKSAHGEQAQAFVQFVLSQDGQEILRKYGFVVVGG